LEKRTGHFISAFYHNQFVACQQKNLLKAIVISIAQHDFASVGCPLPMGCYFGGLCGTDKNLGAVRKMIETSIDCLQKAREAGVNSVYIKQVESGQ
jgi:alpha-D-ribose 1-methylphosphonate 5-phosphate C-P lyase